MPVDPGWTPLWPGTPAPSFERRLDLSRGDDVTDTTLRCSVHTGTHVDAPAHALGDGATVEKLMPEIFLGPCRVVDLRGVERVNRADLRERIDTLPDRLLLRTDNSDRWSGSFDPDFVGLNVDAARWIADGGVELLGIDYLSVQPFDGPYEVHRALLGAGVVLLEGVNLSGVTPGSYELVCLPLKLAGVEAAPARALLRPLEDQR